MNVFVRVDASAEIGSGHLMRCLTLADYLKTNNCRVSFICRELPGNLCHIAEAKGFTVYRLPYMEAGSNNYKRQPLHSHWLGVSPQVDADETIAVLQEANETADWLVTDHYALDYIWEQQVQPYVGNLMVIDDLADRRHDCDLLVDPNMYENAPFRYENLVPAHCQLLLGPKYALLRREFSEARKHLRQRDGSIKRILIFFGGSDLTGETLKALEAIRLLDKPEIAVDVVIGVNNPNKKAIEELDAEMRQVTCYDFVENISQRMLEVDLYIGAAGTTTWERCCLGLPSLVVTVAQNQIQPILELTEHSLLYFIGEHDKVSRHEIKSALEYMFENPAALRLFATNSLALVDGLGAERCVQTLLSFDRTI